MCNRIITVALLAMFLSCTLLHAQTEQPVLSVCDALNQRSVLNGRKAVVIKGELIGTDEGAWLRSMAPCSTEIELEGLKWPSAISLEIHNNIPVPKVRPRAEGEKIIVVLEGEFVTHVPFQRVLYNGRIIGFGFGHLGAAPAMLVVARYRQTEILEGQKPGTGR